MEDWCDILTSQSLNQSRYESDSCDSYDSEKEHLADYILEQPLMPLTPNTENLTSFLFCLVYFKVYSQVIQNLKVSKYLKLCS